MGWICGDGTTVGIVKDFLLQLAFIPTAIFVYQIYIAEIFKKSGYVKMIESVLFGMAILIGMMFPVHVSFTFHLDIRLVPLLLGTLFGGWEVGLFLSTLIILYRLYEGVNVGLYTTIITLVMNVPIFIILREYFIRANTRKQVLITLILVFMYDGIGFTSAILMEPVSVEIIRAALIQLVVGMVFVALFVALNGRIKGMLQRNQQLQSEAKDVEIAFLRSQINPHFLYNALNAITALCIDEPRRAKELILDLSQVLKNNFDFKRLETLTTIENELDLVKAYLNIEKARFGDRLRVEYDVDADADLSIWIPPLILQPLVENAVRHGLMGTLRGGTVKISIKQETASHVRFVIEDDGEGMSEARQKDIMKPCAEKRGVGIPNISQRILHHYGSPIRIESAEGMGTKVIIEIPA